MNDGFAAAAALLPGELRRAALSLPERSRRSAEEFRLRTGYPATVLLPGGESPLLPGKSVGAWELACVLEGATGASAHSAADSMRRGFVTAAGGCRVGLCGAAIVRDGAVSGLRSLSSVCIRIPRQVRGCADGLRHELVDGGFVSTLVVSPPGGGKTTLLRELIRLLSDAGERVAVADERCEISGADGGPPCFELGRSTDILGGAPKAEGAMLLLKAMNPTVVAMDEITSAEDALACAACANCGVRLLATVHAGSAPELNAKRALRPLLEQGAFARAVHIRRRADGTREYEVNSL